jgi:hypothetical protein
VYLDSASNSGPRKDYSNIKDILDDALFTFNGMGGHIRKTKRARGRSIAFAHKTEFWCVKQPTTSKMDGFYVIHHIQ